jgi:hypothetical protein
MKYVLSIFLIHSYYFTHFTYADDVIQLDAYWVNTQLK